MSTALDLQTAPSLFLTPALVAPLTFCRLELKLTLIDPVSLYGQVGYALRGALGAALNEGAPNPIDPTALAGASLYQLVFEPPKTPGKLDPPPAYLIHPPSRAPRYLETGDTLTFGLTLLGEAAAQAPAVLHALFQHGLNGGLGNKRARFLLREALAVTPGGDVSVFHVDGEAGRCGARSQLPGGATPTRWDPRWSWTAEQFLTRRLRRHPTFAPDRVSLEFLTPVIILEQKRSVERLDFSLILRSLLRNVGAHLDTHAGHTLEGIIDHRGLKERSWEVRCVRDNSRPVRVKHDSSRQGRKIPHQGFLGSMCFEGELEPFVPWLELGTLLGVGKERSHGCGSVRWQCGWPSYSGLETPRRRAVTESLAH